jgi:hypothetical protein
MQARPARKKRMRKGYYLTGMVLLGASLGWAFTASGLGYQRPPPQSFADAQFRPFEPPPDPTRLPDTPDFPDPIESPVPTATPEPTPEPTPKPTPVPTPRPRTVTNPNHNITGKASWYATGRNGPWAAACKPLRDAMGSGWRGEQVLVSYKTKVVVVVLNDYCASKDKTIDLSDDAFSELAPLSRGVIRVGVGW